MALPLGFDPATGKFTGVYNPRVQSSHNNYGSAFSLDSDDNGFTRPVRRENLWGKINYAIKSAGNWIDDIIDPVSTWFSIIAAVAGVIGLLIWVFSDGYIGNMILRFIGACIIGYVGMIGIGIIAWVFHLLLKMIRFIFWNAYTLLIAIILIGVASAAEFTLPNIARSSAQTEIVTTPTQTYVCTAYILNIRTAPNTYSEVIGTVNRGETVEVYDTEKGFGRIKHNGRTGYVSLKYLKKTNNE